MQARFAFLCVGGSDVRRHVVDYGRTFAGFCRCDDAAPVHLPAFLSSFSFPADLPRHVESHDGSTRGYDGPVGVPAVRWDLDRDDPAAALHDGARLALYILDRYRLDADDLLVGYSGSKGVHLELPLPAGAVEPSTHANRTARLFAARVAGTVGVRIDTATYDKLRCWRLWNSRHASSGLHKIRLDADDLPGLTLDAVRRLAAEPIPFDPPTPTDSAAILTDLRLADSEVRGQVERRENAAKGRDRWNGTVSRWTLEFIRGEVEVGERRPRLYRAARELFEIAGRYGTDALIRALLTEPALDCGIRPADVERQITCGITDQRKAQGGQT